MMLVYDTLGLVAAATLGLLVWLPGMWALGKRMEWSLPGVLSAAFALCTVATGVAASAAWILGSTLWAVVILLAVQIVMFAVLAWRHPVAGSVRLAPQGLVLGLLGGGLALYERPWFEFTADTFYHLAAARSLLASGAPLVSDPLYKTATSGLDPTSGVFHTWLAASSRVSGLQVEYVYTGFTAVAAAVVVWAFWSLAERASDSPTAATIASVAFVVFGLWGDFRPAGMPNRFILSFVCVLLLALLESTAVDRGRSATAGFVAIVASAALLLTHLAGAGAWLLFTVSTAGVVLFFGRRLRKSDSRPPSCGIVAVAILVAVPIMIPKLDAVFVGGMGWTARGIPDAFATIGGLLYVRPGQYIGGGPWVFALMVAIALVALWKGYKAGNSRDLTVAALLTGPIVFLCFPPVTTLVAAVSTYMIARIARLLVFIPFLAAAWAIGRGLRGTGRARIPSASGGWALLSTGLILLALHGFSSWAATEVTFVDIPGRMRSGEGYTVAESRVTDVRNSWGLQALSAAREVFGDGYPVVAGTPETAYYMAGLANVAVVAAPGSHSPISVETVDGRQRRDDMSELMDPATSEIRRREILEDRDAEYVVLWLARDEDILAWESMQAQTALLQPVVESRRLVVLRVVR